MTVSKKMIEAVDARNMCSDLSNMYDDGDAFALDAADKMLLAQDVIDAAWTEFDAGSTGTFPNTDEERIWLCQTSYGEFKVLTWATRPWVSQGVLRYASIKNLMRKINET